MLSLCQNVFVGKYYQLHHCFILVKVIDENRKLFKGEHLFNEFDFQITKSLPVDKLVCIFLNAGIIRF